MPSPNTQENNSFQVLEDWMSASTGVEEIWSLGPHTLDDLISAVDQTFVGLPCAQQAFHDDLELLPSGPVEVAIGQNEQSILQRVHDGAKRDVTCEEALQQDSQAAKYLCWEHGCAGKEFTNFSNYRRHCREKSHAHPRLFCETCWRDFSRRAAKVRHQKEGRCRPSDLSERHQISNTENWDPRLPIDEHTQSHAQCHLQELSIEPHMTADEILNYMAEIMPREATSAYHS